MNPSYLRPCFVSGRSKAVGEMAQAEAMATAPARGCSTPLPPQAWPQSSLGILSWARGVWG